MMKQIGSEFEYTAPQPGQRGLDWLPLAEDHSFTFSGRTALETVIRDTGAAGKVLMPSYCCDSMIEPFRQAGMQVEFYPVRWENGLRFDFDIPADCRIVVYCNYFGFDAPFLPEHVLETVRANGGWVVEDITHSLLSDHPGHPQSDYYVASLRKWFPLYSGGLCVKRCGELRYKPTQTPDREFMTERDTAMRMKRAYIDAGNVGDKDEFLRLYGEANRWLARHYTGLAMDEDSLDFLSALDIDGVRSRRIRNAGTLYAGLRNLHGVAPLFEAERMGCPLFVPVVIEERLRGQIRQKLTDSAIYCPIHWPRPDGCASNLYDMELSLICDQRYTEEDMERIVEVLSETTGNV